MSAGNKFLIFAVTLLVAEEELKQQFAGGNLPPPHTRSFSGHKLVQDNPVAAAGDD